MKFWTLYVVLFISLILTFTFQGYYQGFGAQQPKLSAFTTNSGQYQMKRLVMGLKTSPSAFSRMMSEAIYLSMSGLTFDKCFVYQDDLIIVGRSLIPHNYNLISVMGKLRKVNLKLNPQKCDFLKKKNLCFGHIVSE